MQSHGSFGNSRDPASLSRCCDCCVLSVFFLSYKQRCLASFWQSKSSGTQVEKGLTDERIWPSLRLIPMAMDGFQVFTWGNDVIWPICFQMGWNHQVVSVWSEFLLVTEIIDILFVFIFYHRHSMYCVIYLPYPPKLQKNIPQVEKLYWVS